MTELKRLRDLIAYLEDEEITTMLHGLSMIKDDYRELYQNIGLEIGTLQDNLMGRLKRIEDDVCKKI